MPLIVDRCERGTGVVGRYSDARTVPVIPVAEDIRAVQDVCELLSPVDEPALSFARVCGRKVRWIHAKEFCGLSKENLMQNVFSRRRLIAMKPETRATNPAANAT